MGAAGGGGSRLHDLGGSLPIYILNHSHAHTINLIMIRGLTT